jgi:protein TonB
LGDGAIWMHDRRSKADSRLVASKSIMGLLHMIDRPEGVDTHLRHHHGLGAVASAASHALVVAALLIGLPYAARHRAPASKTTFDAKQIIWIPQALDGGGRDSGGDQSQQPARRAQARGNDRISVPASPQPSERTIADSPTEPITISAVPMGDAQQFLAGPIFSERPGDALGPNTGRGGDGDGPTTGQGNGPSTGVGNGVYSLGPGVTTPIPIQQVKPQYTANAMRAKVQGSVWLECIVLPDGSVGNVRVTRSLDRQFGLDEEALLAAKQWRFKPGMVGGRPVAVAILIELTFTLR